MISEENLEKIKSCVHKPLNWEDYTSTDVVQKTNSLSHAIGSTIALDKQNYRLGAISGKKEINVGYNSEDEVKKLFLSDTSQLGLEVEQISVGYYIPSFLKNIEEDTFASNEYVVLLFIEVYANGKIGDFHFLRYDVEKGWSEKRRGYPVAILDDIVKEWPLRQRYELVGAFKMRR